MALREKHLTLQAALQSVEGLTLRPGLARHVESPRLAIGLTGLDALLGGGLPIGQASELSSTTSSGAGSLSYHILRAGQDTDRLVCVLDLEHGFDIECAQTQRVDTQSLILIQPESSDETLPMLDALLGSGIPMLLGVWGGLSLWGSPSAPRRLLHRLRRTDSLLILHSHNDQGNQHQAPLVALRLIVTRVIWLRDDHGQICGYRSRVKVARHQGHAAGESVLADFFLDRPPQEVAP